jgi:hypothetical protein
VFTSLTLSIERAYIGPLFGDVYIENEEYFKKSDNKDEKEEKKDNEEKKINEKEEENFIKENVFEIEEKNKNIEKEVDDVNDNEIKKNNCGKEINTKMIKLEELPHKINFPCIFDETVQTRYEKN